MDPMIGTELVALPPSFSVWDVPKKKDDEDKAPPRAKDMTWRPTWDHNFVADNQLSPNYWKIVKTSHKTRDIVWGLLGLKADAKDDPHKEPSAEKVAYNQRKAVRTRRDPRSSIETPCSYMLTSPNLQPPLTFHVHFKYFRRFF
jgi:hypothetical protein